MHNFFADPPASLGDDIGGFYENSQLAQAARAVRNATRHSRALQRYLATAGPSFRASLPIKYDRRVVKNGYKYADDVLQNQEWDDVPYVAEMIETSQDCMIDVVCHRYAQDLALRTLRKRRAAVHTQRAAAAQTIQGAWRQSRYNPDGSLVRRWATATARRHSLQP